ncbi:hypothetical protein ABTE11_21690, partial [Acinetobacter baumannii]
MPLIDVRSSRALAWSMRAPAIPRWCSAANQVSSPKAPVLKKLALGTHDWLLYDTISVPLRERNR